MQGIKYCASIFTILGNLMLNQWSVTRVIGRITEGNMNGLHFIIHEVKSCNFNVSIKSLLQSTSRVAFKPQGLEYLISVPSKCLISG